MTKERIDTDSAKCPDEFLPELNGGYHLVISVVGGDSGMLVKENGVCEDENNFEEAIKAVNTSLNTTKVLALYISGKCLI